MTDINRYYPYPPPSPPPPQHDPHGPNSPRHFIKKLTEKVDFGEDVDFVVGVTATALTADQLIKQTTCKDHKVMHLAKAGLGAAVAATAFTMMSREHNQRKHAEKKNNPHHDHYIHRARNRSLSRDSSPHRLLENGHHHEEKEEWAVVRSRSPDPRHARSASVGATKRGDYWSRNPRYYEDDDSDRSVRGFDDGPPYPDEGRHRRRDASLSRSISPEPETRRPRAYSHGDTHRGGGGRSASPNTLKRMWKLVRDGMEYYDRYDRNRR
ncbi:hypothetical protein V8F06_005120 [Rhypophila decipiens]